MIELDNLNSPANEQSSMRLSSAVVLLDRKPAPIKALICKNLALQRKSIFTNVCQVASESIFR